MLLRAVDGRMNMSIYEFFTLTGGIGLFLFGMTMMSTGLKNACGDNLRVILEHATKNRFISVLVGLAMTILVQSSSATDVMVIGFVNSGLMTLAQAIGVIMGANIGTTVTAQITAFNLGAYAPLILFVGAVLYLFVKRNLPKHIGSVIMGFGMLFEGISLMKSAIAPLSQTESFINLVSSLQNPILLVLFGVAFTALLQSSSSATVIFQAFAVQGILTYRASVYLVIGAAIGSVTPNLLAALTSNRNGKRSAILNLIFNLFRAVILMILIGIFPQILTAIQSLSPDNIGRQIANTHTIFAIFAVLVLLPFSGLIVKLAELIIPVHEEETRSAEERKLRFMVQTGNIPAAVAIDQARREISRMGSIAFRNMDAALDCFFNPEVDRIDEVLETEETVNILEQAILEKLIYLRTMEMSPADMRKVYHLTLTVADVERISDHAENIVEYAQQLRNKKAVISETGMEELKKLATLSMDSVKFCLSIFETQNYALLDKANELEDNVDECQEAVIAGHVDRLMHATCDPMGGVIFTDLATDLERCSDHAINIAEALVDNTY